MTFSFPSPEFDDAVADVCHGCASEAEMRALNELLRSDATARDEYLLRVELHSRLASDPDLFCQDQAEQPVSASATEVLNRSSRRKEARTTFNNEPPYVGCYAVQGEGARRASAQPWASASRRKAATILALTACLALLATGIWSLWFRQPVSKTGATSTAVAMLTRIVDAHWSQTTAPVRVGGALAPGWLRLESGLAQVVFYSGTRVVIEGPAELQLVSQNEAICPTGRLLAEVPPPARGFRLKTDHLNVVDLGTAFGIDATKERTEVHVFQGKVELLTGTTARQSLSKGEAAVAAGNTPPRLMTASPAAFAALFEFQQRSLVSEAFRYEQWQFANARLNQDPSLVVRLDFENLGGADWTLRNAAEKNRSVAEATIVGCQRAEGRWREKQALELQSIHDRVRLAVPGEFDTLTLAAWVRVTGLDRQFNSLFMCDGFEPGTIHWLVRNDGVLGLTVFGPDAGNVQIMASPPVLTRDRLGMWLHLAVVVDGKAGKVVHYVNGAPVSRHALKLGPPFRLGPAELGNWNGISGPNPAPGLIRNLSGSLDEFALFSRALTDAQVRELYATGKPDE